MNRECEYRCPNPTQNEKCLGVLFLKDKYSVKYAIRDQRLCKSCGYLKGVQVRKLNGSYKTSEQAKLNISISLKKSHKESNYVVWNKGLNAKTDARVAKTGKSRPGKLNPNFGSSYLKKWIEWYGEEEAIKMNIECGKLKARHGENNGMFGRSYLDIWKANFSEEEFNAKYTFNSYIKSQSRLRNKITFEQWKLQKLNSIDEFKEYKKLVNKFTNQNNLARLPNSDKRGRASINGAYHLDHMISIKFGFVNNLSPEFIGSIWNLWFVPWEINLQKSDSFDNFWKIEQYYPVDQYGERVFQLLTTRLKRECGFEIDQKPLPKLKRIKNAD